MRRFFVVLFVLFSLSCAAPPQQPESTAVENLDLGLKLAALPDGMAVLSNQGSSLELTPSGEGEEGVLWFAVGPEQDGVNLVAAVQDHQARMEVMDEGDYKGAQELQGDFGTAFYSRGRFVDAGALVEETVVFMIHPAGTRLLAIHYRYPAGDDSAARVEELIDVVSYLE